MNAMEMMNALRKNSITFITMKNLFEIFEYHWIKTAIEISNNLRHDVKNKAKFEQFYVI